MVSRTGESDGLDGVVRELKPQTGNLVLKVKHVSIKALRVEFARENGITGVPTFHAKDLFLYGSQPYEVVERFYNNLRRKG